MQIACTAKTAEFLKRSLPKATVFNESDPFYSWHAHTIVHERRKIILLVNDLTGFPVIFYRPKASVFSDFETVARNAISRAFRVYGINPSWIEEYFKRAGEIELNAKTSRSVITKLNHLKDAMLRRLYEYAFTPFNESTVDQPAFALNVLPYFWTNYRSTEELLESAFASLGATAENFKTVMHYRLKVTLALGRHEVWREVLMPAYESLETLHALIQLTFGWQHSHLHRFALTPKGEDDLYSQDVVQILTGLDPHADEYIDEPFYNDAALTLVDIRDKQDSDLWYEYDFGDSWCHKVEIVGVSFLPTRRYSLIAIKGECPPDDVGGETGYELFYQSSKDPTDPEHLSWLDWAHMQTQHRLSFEAINKKLADDNWIHPYRWAYLYKHH